MEGQVQSKINGMISDISIKDIFFKYMRFLPLIFISIALAFTVAYLYLRYTTPIYNSTGALFIKGDNNKGTADNDKFAQMFVLDNSLNIANEIELLRSRRLMEEVVEALNLNFTYHAVGKITQLHLYKNEPFWIEANQINDSSSSFRLNIEVIDDRTFHINNDLKSIAFGESFTNKYGTFRINKKPGYQLINRYIIDWQPTRVVAGELAFKIQIYPRGSTGILNISLESTHPVLAAEVINLLMKEYKRTTIDDKNENKQQTLDFIDRRIKSISEELDSVNGRLLIYQKTNNLINSESQSTSYFTRIEGNEKQIMEENVQVSMAEMIENYLRDQKHAYDQVLTTFGLVDPTLSAMIALYNTALMERKALIDANTPATNPLVKEREEGIAKLRMSILENLSNLKKYHTAAIQRLKQNSSETKSQIEMLPEKEQTLFDIKRNQEMKQTVYNFLLEKKEEMSMSVAGTISNIKVVEDALPSWVPIKPDRKTIYLIALLVGLVIPVLGIYISEILNDKISTRQDIEKLTSVPIIAEIGHSYKGEVLEVSANNRGIVAEQFRIMRSNLQFILTTIQKPVLLVTSSYSGEGKSFISTNLGAVMSLANKKTIVLEFDIRKPMVLTGLGMSKKPGLTNFLLGSNSMDELPIKIDGFDNLYVLPCGPIPPNPSELLLDKRIKDLFSYLKQNFDVIVIDTAPVGMVSDALTLSEFADASLYLVRQGRTFKKQIAIIDELAQHNKLPKISIVLNDVRSKAGYGYYGYGRYGYGSSGNKNNGYFEEEARPSSFWKRWFGWDDTKKRKREVSKNKQKMVS